VIYKDPFEEYKTRLAKKLARQSESEQNGGIKQLGKKEGDDVNWFGVKLGIDSPRQAATLGSESGVGKYLNLKRPREASSGKGYGGVDDIDNKKRKIGFGNFDSW